MGGAVSSGRDNNELVDNLMSGNYIRSRAVERVFRVLDRADYMSPEARDQAYKDLAWRHGPLHLSAPCIYSEVMEALELRPGLSFLNVGSGTGYLSTMVGLIIGSSGISHGVETLPVVFEYANKKLSQFIENSVILDEFDFCFPKYYTGNGLCLAPTHTYDRVYCGAGVLSRHENYFKQLTKVGGVLVMPLSDTLVQLRRVSDTHWTKRSLLNVSFALLREPHKEETEDLVKLEEQCPPSLQILSRACIRSAMKGAMMRRHPELRPPPLAPKPPARTGPRRICIPYDGPNTGDHHHTAHLNGLHELDEAGGAHEMNALLSLVLSMGQNRAAGSLRLDAVNRDQDGTHGPGDGGVRGDSGDSGDGEGDNGDDTEEYAEVGDLYSFDDNGADGSLRTDRVIVFDVSPEIMRRWPPRTQASAVTDEPSTSASLDADGQTGSDTADRTEPKVDSEPADEVPSMSATAEIVTKTDCNMDTGTKPESSAKSDTGPKTETDGKSDTYTKSDTDAKSGKGAKPPSIAKTMVSAVLASAGVSAMAGSSSMTNASTSARTSAGISSRAGAGFTPRCHNGWHLQRNQNSNWSTKTAVPTCSRPDADTNSKTDADTSSKTDAGTSSKTDTKSGTGTKSKTNKKSSRTPARRSQLVSVPWDDTSSDDEEVTQEKDNKRQKLDSGIGEGTTSSGASPDQSGSLDQSVEALPLNWEDDDLDDLPWCVSESSGSDSNSDSDTEGGKGKTRAGSKDVTLLFELKRKKLDSGIGGEPTENRTSTAGETSRSTHVEGRCAGRRRVGKRGRGGAGRRAHTSGSDSGADADPEGGPEGAGGAPPAGRDQRRVRLSLVMKRGVKELPLPHALKQYVNLGRCYQF